MITDAETTHIYLADTLEKDFNDFFTPLNVILQQCKVPMERLRGTADAWARDYMPIQVRKDKFVQFNFDLDCLNKKGWRHLKTDTKEVLKNYDLPITKSDLIVDGGNVIKGKNWVIMTRKAIEDNEDKYSGKEINRQLEELFEVERIIWIPWQPDYDEFGHADGMVRYYDDNTVLINDCSIEKKDFADAFHKDLKDAGLDWIEMPYHPSLKKHDFDACAIYINYLQMKDLVIIPVVNMEEDDRVIEQFCKLFPRIKIRTLFSNDIAREGGILNCVSWTIKK